MTEPVPSKELFTDLSLLRASGFDDAADTIEFLRQDNRRWENAHKILMAENSRLLAELRAANEPRQGITSHTVELTDEPCDHPIVNQMETNGGQYVRRWCHKCGVTMPPPEPGLSKGSIVDGLERLLQSEPNIDVEILPDGTCRPAQPPSADHSWYSGQVNEDACKEIVRLKREGDGRG